MAYDHHLYTRRCSELGIDPEYRIGKLTYVCKILSDRHNAVCGVLMLCDCGRVGKIGIPKLHRGGEALPFECSSCHTTNRRRSNTCKKKAKARAGEVRDRKLASRGVKRMTGDLKRNFPSEYVAWRNCLFVLKNDMIPAWKGKGGFLRFMADMGGKPWPKARLFRKDKGLPYGPGNAVWAKPK